MRLGMSAKSVTAIRVTCELPSQRPGRCPYKRPNRFPHTGHCFSRCSDCFGACGLTSSWRPVAPSVRLADAAPSEDVTGSISNIGVDSSAFSYVRSLVCKQRCSGKYCAHAGSRLSSAHFYIRSRLNRVAERRETYPRNSVLRT
jgi:hypothetical protein